MSGQLKISLGQHSDKGRKNINQDYHGVHVPKEPLLSGKGIAIALADGISSSGVSQIASQSAVTGFLTDYFCTTETWSVKKSAQRVLAATNSWLHAQTRQSQYQYDKDRGYVCTFSALIIKSTTAHLFHVGDTRIYRLKEARLEQLTNDHRLWISQNKSYLSRALGINPHVEIDHHTVPLEQGDCFLLMTDGVYEFVSLPYITESLKRFRHNLDKAAREIVAEAYRRGSSDNLTIQIVSVDELPQQNADELHRKLTERPFPPLLEARMEFDGYTILRELHASSRSHVYLAQDQQTRTRVVIKTPSIDQRDDTAYLERFLLEDWIARRIDSPYVMKPCPRNRPQGYLYTASEFIEGMTLTQWMTDHPHPDLETVRGIVEQIAKGLRAFHRLEMLHQDVRPDNIMIDRFDTVKIIDFGSTRVAGIMEIATPVERGNLLGTAAYTAPEYFLGQSGTIRSDLFSLAVLAYQLLSGRLPYGTQVAKCRSHKAQGRLHYRPLVAEREIPSWIDAALHKALQPNPDRRQADVAEFIYDLRHPNKTYLRQTRPPLMERNPVVFWQGVALLLALTVVILTLKLE